MDGSYSPFNPVIWILFGLFVLAVWLTVKLFHRRYPRYPHGDEKDDE